ncbi:hypothetical protein [Sphingomonas faeni]|uniref:hypothetical protein n=1 Tax=Sphingomonas faeni TaxID=185950 RepID=UPI001FC9D989|nr:hypothetical protein [Sphingomonas faeni]
MHKLNGRILSIAIGFALLTALPACARHADAPPAVIPAPIVVKVKDTPPAELLTCATRPEGLPEDPSLIAQIPTKIRAGIIRLARAFAGNADRADRLVNWNVPGSCPAAKTAP